MEITKHSPISHDAYLLNQQAGNAGQNSISPAEQIEDQLEDSQKPSKTHDITAEEKSEHLEKTQEAQIHELFEPINITRAKRQNDSQGVNNRQPYTVAAHNENISHQATTAINAYNTVENSPEGQELVNRIELLV